MTSRADDFDVRYRATGTGRHRGPAGMGTTSGSATQGNGTPPSVGSGGVDYDLGYDDSGWDTQGFRTPEGGYRTPPPSPAQTYDAPAPVDPFERTLHSGSSTDDTELVGVGTGGTRQLQRDLVPGSPGRSRRGTRRAGGPGGPGPNGPGGPGGPGGPRGPRGRGNKVKGSWWRRWTWRKVLGLFLSLIGALIIGLAVGILYIYNHTPVPTEQMAAAAFQQSTVYASDGRTVIGRFGTTDRQVLNYNQIPTRVIDSVLSAEDRNFFNEGGVSPTGILRAAYEDTLGGGNFQGGSTITQQFVRNYYQGIGTSQTASRKIKEIFVSMKIARSKSKQWILENYLNTIYLGQSAYGIGAAAHTYFNIPVQKLGTITWSQAALLAAIIQQPSTYPLKQYHTQLESRWEYVRSGLLKMGWINQADYDKMSFPVFGNYTPPSYGSQPWDPYVLAEVENELTSKQFNYTMPQLENGGYKIVTTINPAKTAALYQAVNTQQLAMASGGEAFQTYMHVGAVLEDPNTGAIEAEYPGPGYPGYKYNGVGKVITPSLCRKIRCNDNLAVYSYPQVGSSFKPYVLSAAVAAGMNVKTSMLDGQDDVCIPNDQPASQQNMFPYAPSGPTGTSCPQGGFVIRNDDPSENLAYSPTDAMTQSINTAYSDLWHYVGGPAVVHIAQQFGVPHTQIEGQEHEAGFALGQAPVSVQQQATMLAAIDDNGVYHQAHIIASISQGNVQYPLTFATHPVFNGDQTTNAQMDSQIQSAMQQVIVSGTAAGKGMSDGRPVISKTGTTSNAQSTFFIGAIPQQALAIGMFTEKSTQTLNGLGGIQQNFGATWSASIWQTYAENQFQQLPPAQFQTPVFSGQKWTLAPSSLLKPKKKKGPQRKHDKGNGNGNGTTTGNGNGNPPTAPTPTATCPPGVVNVDCNPLGNGNGNGTGTGTSPSPNPNPTGFGGNFNLGNTPNVGGSQTGAAAFGGGVVGLPVTLLWVRRRRRKR